MERPQARAPVYAHAMRAQEAPDVIRGIFSLYDLFVHALIDLGSMHSYVCIELPMEKRSSNR